MLPLPECKFHFGLGFLLVCCLLVVFIFLLDHFVVLGARECDSLGLIRNRPQDRVRSAKKIIGVTPVKHKKRKVGREGVQTFM